MPVSPRKSSPRGNAHKLVANSCIKSYIEERLAEIKSRKTADATEVMEYLTSVLRGETTSEVVVNEFIGGGCSEARRVEKKPDEKERLKAAELLGKRFGLYTDKVDVSGSIPIVVSGGEDLED